MLAKTATNGGYSYAPHIKYFERKALELTGRAIRFLLIEVPPRHGKSEYWSKYFPAWYISMFPTHRVVLASYEAGFARQWGRRTRDLVAAYGGLFGTHVREDVAAQDEWETTAGGGMVTLGMGGAVTGRGADLIIIDDPHKNAEDALSQTMRQKVWDTWQSTLFTRLEPNGIVVIIQTRWHTDDLIGRLLTEQALPWTRVHIPAIAEDDDVLGRAPGQALWPQRYDAAALAEIRQAIGSYWWSALYQQSPTPVGDTLFRAEWSGRWLEQNGIYALKRPHELKPYLVSKARCIRFGTMDLAVSTKTSADYTVLGSWALTPEKELILLGIDRRKLEAPDQPAMIAANIQRYGLSFVGIEATAYQLSLVQMARRQGLPVKAIYADKDKYARALTGSAVQEGGRMYFPYSADWLAAFERELYGYPTEPNDDQVDVVSMAAIYSSNAATQGSID